MTDPIETATAGVSDADANGHGDVTAPVELTDPSLYTNRELSWLDFNDRVLQLAEDETLPLIERLKFLAIFVTNLDEHFMIRVAGVHDQVDARIDARGPDGISPSELLGLSAERIRELDRRHALQFQEVIRPELAEHGIRIVSPDESGADPQRHRAPLPRAHLPGADAARDRPGASVPLHLESVAEPDRPAPRS